MTSNSTLTDHITPLESDSDPIVSDELIASAASATPDLRAGWSRFWRIAVPLVRLGYPVVPTRPGEKAPRVRFGWLTDAKAPEVLDSIRESQSRFPDSDGLWMLDAMPGGIDLDDLDYDDLADLPWGIQTFGESKLTMTTGREGGGVHHLFRRDPRRPRDERGSRVGIAGRKIDLKTWHGYAVAPGSTHRTGIRYRLYWDGVEIDPFDVTREMIEQLPVLDRDVLDRVLGEDYSDGSEVEGFVEFGFGDPRFARARRSKGGAGLPKQHVEAGARFREGRFAGRTVEDVARQVWTGEASVCCPHSEWTHSTDSSGGTSALLHAIDGRPTHTTCYACSTVYTYSTARVDGGNGDSKEESLSGNTVPLRIELGPEDLTERGYLDSRKLRLRSGGRSVLVLQVGVGRGKTEVASELVRGARKVGEWALAVCPTRSLSRALASRLGLRCYLDEPDTGTLDAGALGGLSVCLPSLARVRLDTEGVITPLRIPLLILDEVEQQLRSLASTHLSDRQSRDAWTALVYAVAHAERILLLDADAGPLTEYLLRAAERWNETAWISGATSTPKTVLRYAKKETMTVTLLDHWAMERRPFIVCQSVDGAEALGRQLREARPDARVAVLTRDTIVDFDLTRVNEWITEYDAVVATSVIGTGVSIDVEHFDSIWAYAQDGLGTAHDLLQQVSRVRRPKYPTIRLFSRHATRKPAAWEGDAEAVYDRWIAQQDQTTRITGLDFVTGPGIPYRRVLTDGAEQYVRMLSRARAADVANGSGRVGDAFCALVEGRGGCVEIVEAGDATPREAEVRKEERAHRDDIRSEDEAAVLAAEPIDEDRARAIRRRGPRSREEAQSYRRHAIERFAGEVSAETVAIDDRGRGRAKARTFAHVVALASGGAGARTVTEMDRRELRSGVSPDRLHHRVARGRALLAILGWVGIDVTEFGGNGASMRDSLSENTVPWRSSPEVLSTLRERVNRPGVREALDFLGLGVYRDFDARPMTLVSTVLDRLGIELQSKQTKKSDGSRERVYSIDPESLEAVRSYSARYRRALDSGDALGSTDEDAVDLTPVRGAPDPATLDAALSAVLAA